MLSFKDHPFAIEAHFERSLVLAYAAPVENIKPFLPQCLSPDTLNEKWGFIAAAFVQVKGLRPKGFPAVMGSAFFLAGYRIFVRYIDKNGKRLRGLYILGSETDKRRMTFLGNIFTHYHYSTTDIRVVADKNTLGISSNKSGLEIEALLNIKEPALPAGSPFHDWKEARRFAGPLPFTFFFDDQTSKVTIIEGVRENWIPQPVQIRRDKIAFIEDKKIPGLVLANAFIIENIPYSWKKGRVETWKL
ncbi:MAG TPA: DUF2071 domain-containing protein [Chitinophagaceae bacterium]|nr:DUF2071 domain-containing protein [Chitinophagaceae bacterium]